MVFGIVKKVLPIAAIGLGLFFLTNVLLRPAQAQQSTDVLSSFGVGLGSGLSSVGAGVQTFLTGIGTGSAQLLNPLFSLKTLFYGDDANAVIEQTQNASSTSRQNPIPNTASDSPGVTIQGGGGSDNTGGTRSSSYGGAGQHGYAHASSVGRFAN